MLVAIIISATIGLIVGGTFIELAGRPYERSLRAELRNGEELFDNLHESHSELDSKFRKAECRAEIMEDAAAELFQLTTTGKFESPKDLDALAVIFRRLMELGVKLTPEKDED